MRRAAAAWLLLLAQAWCALAAPLLHQIHHARFGDDHRHEGGALHRDARAHRHARFDADLESLHLADVAAAGALAVDCGLAAYTLVVCDEAAARHAPNFGDALPDQQAPPDPTHGRGAALHLAALLLPSSPILLPPAPVPAPVPVPDLLRLPPRDAPRVAHPGRAPPPPPTSHA